MSASASDFRRDVVGLCGSLRTGSLNGLALRLAGQCMPQGMSLDILDWREVPPFDAGRLAAQGMPAPVEALRQRIGRAHALIVATPEYNFSVPGMLKNLLDWLSRGEAQPLAGKPVALMSASTGPLGGARVQYDMRRVLLCMNAQVLAKPEIFIGAAQQKFSSNGECTDTPTRDFVTAQMLALSRWISQVEAMSGG
ncbi:NAD(P)H-dependent FMN reductase [Variovorax sp. OK605]|uniref:NADPH-dependent FMN reductase n=1 Tax=Variovorax sp. OK605 TaxID=1855317 RepID=UPI0008EB2FF9|nr:NAD(P)H-dependent oxidoreductase [Variovorax sp. OK605]SFP60257.1 NAD(P)H-dependent FMN reductase [Variovorax sp. OK605]